MEVSKRFGDTVVLDRVSLLVREGETLVLLGPSGTGKSVLLKHVIGLIEPDEGDVRVDSVSVVHASRRQLQEIRDHVGYVFQGSALFDSMSVAENILLGLNEEECARLGDQGCESQVTTCLRLVNLEPPVADLYPAELSGGMKKRVAIARAIAGEQRYLLYDEPTTGLDPENTEIITNLIAGLQKRLNVTSIVVTHDVESAFRVADRVALLYGGRIRAEGTVEEFIADPDPVVQRFVRPLRRSTPAEIA